MLGGDDSIIGKINNGYNSIKNTSKIVGIGHKIVSPITNKLYDIFCGEQIIENSWGNGFGYVINIIMNVFIILLYTFITSIVFTYVLSWSKKFLNWIGLYDNSPSMIYDSYLSCNVSNSNGIIKCMNAKSNGIVISAYNQVKDNLYEVLFKLKNPGLYLINYNITYDRIYMNNGYGDIKLYFTNSNGKNVIVNSEYTSAEGTNKLVLRQTDFISTGTNDEIIKMFITDDIKIISGNLHIFYFGSIKNK